MSSISDLMDEFGGPAIFARAIGIEESHARTMKARKSIPARYWARIVNAARDSGLAGISFERLVDLHSRSCSEGDPS